MIFGADIWLNFYFELIENDEINIDNIKETEIKIVRNNKIL